MTIHSVKMAVGHGRIAIKGRPIETMVHLKKSIIEVKLLAFPNYLTIKIMKHIVQDLRYVRLWTVYLGRQVLICKMAEGSLS